MSTTTLTVVDPKQAEEFADMKKKFMESGGHAPGLVRYFYELGRKHGRESADAENALIQDAVEQANAETQHHLIRNIVGTVLMGKHSLVHISVMPANTSAVGLVIDHALIDWEARGYELDASYDAEKNQTTWTMRKVGA